MKGEVGKSCNSTSHSTLFIKSRENLVKIIQGISEADINDGGKGAFYIFLKKNENEQ